MPIDSVAAYLQWRRDFSGPIPGYAYRNIEHFVFDHGQSWTTGPRPKGVRQRAMKQCFANAYKLVTSPQGERLGLRYVEGYAAGIIPMHHAWAVTPDGMVVDPTWKPETGTSYYGVAFDIELVNAAILLSGTYGVMDDWRNRHPLLREPYEPATALDRLGQLAKGGLATT